MADLQKNMTEERTQSEINTQTAAQHAEIMEKVEQLNEVIESNKVLTNEKERAEKTVKELAEKVCFILIHFAVKPLGCAFWFHLISFEHC